MPRSYLYLVCDSARSTWGLDYVILLIRQIRRANERLTYVPAFRAMVPWSLHAESQT